MKRLLLTLALLLVTVSAEARGKLQGWVERGGSKVTINNGLQSTQTFQRSYPGATVTVKLAGTSTNATIYSDAAGTAKSNPFSADSSGFWFFWADDGDYDVTFSGSVAYTLSSLRVISGAGGWTDVRFADQYAGATTDLKMVAAGAACAGSPCIVAITSNLAASAYPSLASHQAGVTYFDLRGGANGAFRVMYDSDGTGGRALVGAIRSANGSGLAEGVVGDAQEAGEGANHHGVSGYVASRLSTGVFGYNYGSSGEGGPGVQGDGADLPSAIGVLGTSGSGGTAPLPAIGVKGVHGGGVSHALWASSADAAGVNALHIEPTATGGRRWTLTGTANGDPILGAGYFGFYSLSGNTYPIAASWDAPNKSLWADSTGAQVGTTTSTVNFHMKGQALQSFIFSLRNNGGTIEHKICSDGNNCAASSWVSKINGASNVYAGTPSVSNIVGFTAGAGIDAGNTNFVIFDTAAITAADFIAAGVSVSYNNSGTIFTVDPTSVSSNVNGVVRNRLLIRFYTNPAGAAFNLTTIPVGTVIEVKVLVYLP